MSRPPDSSIYKKTVIVHVEESMHEALRRLAFNNAVSMATIVRKSIKEILEKQKNLLTSHD